MPPPTSPVREVALRYESDAPVKVKAPSMTLQRRVCALALWASGVEERGAEEEGDTGHI